MPMRSVSPRLLTPRSPPPAVAAAVQTLPFTEGDDPNRGRFGGSAERDGRRLCATWRHVDRDWMRIRVRVCSTASGAPLVGAVRFHLPPGFGQRDRVVPVCSGVASLELLAWYPLVIGVSADGGATVLELDLAEALAQLAAG